MTDLREELELLVEEWRARSKALWDADIGDDYDDCADDLEAVLRRTAAAELTRMSQEDGEL